jgi:hypothetical protein
MKQRNLQGLQQLRCAPCRATSLLLPAVSGAGRDLVGIHVGRIGPARTGSDELEGLLVLAHPVDGVGATSVRTLDAPSLEVPVQGVAFSVPPLSDDGRGSPPIVHLGVCGTVPFDEAPGAKHEFLRIV